MSVSYFVSATCKLEMHVCGHYVRICAHGCGQIHQFNSTKILGQRFMLRQHTHGKTTDFLRYKILLRVFFFLKDK